MTSDLLINVFGKASNKIIKIIAIEDHTKLDLSLMEFLTAHGLTIASSCNGEGTCKKCIVNATVLSCQISVKEFIEKHGTRVEIAYL